VSYREARGFAEEFFAALHGSATIAGEVEAAIEECVRRYDTGPYENRFIVGAVVEQIIGAAARSFGLEVKNAGARRQAYDLELRPGLGLSVKYTSVTGRSGVIRLTNSQGAVGVWDTGTIFVVAGVGVGYADDELLPGCTKTSGDGRSLDVSLERIRQLWGLESTAGRGPAPMWLSAMPVPHPVAGYFAPLEVPLRATVKAPRLAGDPIALDILQSGLSPNLLANFQWSV